MRRVLVTGASGFVGRQVVAALGDYGFEIHAVGRRSFAYASGVIGHICDLADEGAVTALMGKVGPTHLVHLAWDVTPGVFWEAAANMDWVCISLRLYQAFAKCGGRRAVFAGTCAEYDWHEDLLAEGATALRPMSLYGAAKGAVFELVRRAAVRDGISLGWARLFMLYGPHEYEARLVPSVARALLRSERAACGRGMAERDFMHVGDAGRAVALLAHGDVKGAVNIASGECVALREVVEIVAKLAGKPDLVMWGARAEPVGEPARLAAATARLRDEVGFSPRFTLREGLVDAVDWWRRELAGGRR